MKKTITSTLVALLMTSSLAGPASANDVARMIVGGAALLLGEAAKNSGHRPSNREPGRGDTLIGRVDGSPIRGQGKSNQAARNKGRPTRDNAVAFLPFPAVVPIPESRPSAEDMVAWNAAAPEREAQAQAADPLDMSTTASTAQQQPMPAPAEEATVELIDNENKSWGKVTPAQRDKAVALGRLGMKAADAYRAIGLKGPIEVPVEPTGRDLIDEDGRLWGNVPMETADRVWKAVDLGMKPSEAIRAITNLQDPDVAKAKALAEADAAKAHDEKTLESCIKKAITIPGTKWTECRPYEAQMEVAFRKDKAAQMARGDAQLATCIDKRLDPTTSEQRFAECKLLEGEIAYLIGKDARLATMNFTQLYNEANKAPTSEELAYQAAAEARKQQAATELHNQGQAVANQQALGDILASKPSDGSAAPAAESQTAAAPPVETGNDGIDEGKTSAIELTPEAPKPVEEPPVKKKPKKLDL